jgi:glycosyltransferase involved in cell wall biosynthesis
VVLTIAVPVEQLWHRVPGGTARATAETLRVWSGDPAIDVRGIAAWHRPDRRRRATDLGAVRYLPLHRRMLYEGWLQVERPTVEQAVGPVDVTWAAATVPPPTSSPLVSTVHDLGFLDHPERSSRRGRAFFPRIWAEVRDRSARIVCPSQVVADQCREHGVDPGRLAVIPWGVAPPISRPAEAEEVRRRLALPERFALWVGTLEPRKNLPRLVRAMIEVPDLPLVVVGPTGWNLDGDDVLAPLGDRARRLGPVDDATLSALYRAATVFVFPSLLEGFGLPVLEAMAHGTPVVTGDSTSTAEIAGGAARLVDVHDPAAIARAVREVADPSDDRTSALIEKGLHRAGELTWKATADAYAAVFRQVAEGL